MNSRRSKRTPWALVRQIRLEAPMRSQKCLGGWLMQSVSAEIGLSDLQARTLFHIDPEQPVRMSEVARRAGYEPSNLTGVVDKLAARGLV